MMKKITTFGTQTKKKRTQQKQTRTVDAPKKHKPLAMKKIKAAPRSLPPAYASSCTATKKAVLLAKASTTGNPSSTVLPPLHPKKKKNRRTIKDKTMTTTTRHRSPPGPSESWLRASCTDRPQSPCSTLPRGFQWGLSREVQPSRPQGRTSARGRNTTKVRETDETRATRGVGIKQTPSLVRRGVTHQQERYATKWGSELAYKWLHKTQTQRRNIYIYIC